MTTPRRMIDRWNDDEPKFTAVAQASGYADQPTPGEPVSAAALTDVDGAVVGVVWAAGDAAGMTVVGGTPAAVNASARAWAARRDAHGASRPASDTVTDATLYPGYQLGEPVHGLPSVRAAVERLS